MLKELFLCLLSAALLILSFPKLNLEILAWVSFVPLFFALKGKSKTKAFLLAYFTGIIFWSEIIYWLVHVTLPGTIILVLYLALYFGIFGLIISSIQYPVSSIQLLFIPSVWVLLEYIRAHLFTGFPWALLGYSQYLNLPVIQIADITGVWGVSFLVMLVNVAVKRMVSPQSTVNSPQLRKIRYILPILCICITLAYGYYRLYRRPSTVDRRTVKISVIQGNIPQDLKWKSQAQDFIMDRYFTLTAGAAKDKPSLVIWPEAALPSVLEEEPRYYQSLKNFIKETKIPLLFGAVTRRDNLYYNSALLVSPEGRLSGRYDKLHLVPFGEYIPLRKVLTFLETVVPIGDFNSGEKYTIFSHQSIKFSVLICFEDLFPELSRQFTKRGADFLVNITNDAWFGDTSSAYQHLQASVFRAVENRAFLVRCANTGVSGFIAPTGKIIYLVRDKSAKITYVSGYAAEEIGGFRENLTFYTRYGDIFILFCLWLFLSGLWQVKSSKRRGYV